MELDLSTHRPTFIVLAAILLLVGTAALGRALLPTADRLLTLSEWQVLKASRSYQLELQHLQTSAENLAALLNARPDPVRAQLLAEDIARLASQGQPALVYSREKLVLAAQAVSDWAVGAIDRESAVQALQDAVLALSLEPALQDTLLPNEARR
jgi:hypothetical protein